MPAHKVLRDNAFTQEFVNFVKLLNLSNIETRALLEAGVNIHATWTDNKVFTYYNHVITTFGRAHADIGLGSEIEFSRQAGPPPAIGDDKCINCALSFWLILLKGGVSW